MPLEQKCCLVWFWFFVGCFFWVFFRDCGDENDTNVIKKIDGRGCKGCFHFMSIIVFCLRVFKDQSFAN